MFAGWLRAANRAIGWLLVVSAVFAGFFLAIGGREYRYLLPILPLLAAASGMALAALPARWKAALPAFIFLQAAWSFYLAARFAWRNWGEIMVPF